MDRRLMLAVAGSGKTTHIIEQLNLEQRFLIVTYTDNNVAHIKKAIIKKFGYEPQNITLLSYFQFLIRVCYRPFLKSKIKAKGITWEMPNAKTLKFKRTDERFYMTHNRYLYHNRIAKLCQERCLDFIKKRLERFYDYFMFDEIQDLGGHDFNLIIGLLPIKMNILFVGDFFQHTFDTSKDGNVNKSLYSDKKKYLKMWNKSGLTIDTTTLNYSHRCSPTICNFVTNKLGIDMKSHRKDEVSILYVSDKEQAVELYKDDTKVKLFFSDSRKYDCYSCNWGASKGLDNFVDICIVLNATTLKAYQNGKFSKLASSTRNKLYVACTRARGNVYFIPCEFIGKFKQSI